MSDEAALQKQSEEDAMAAEWAAALAEGKPGGDASFGGRGRRSSSASPTWAWAAG